MEESDGEVPSGGFATDVEGSDSSLIGGPGSGSAWPELNGSSGCPSVGSCVAGLPESASLPTKVPSLELCIDPDDGSDCPWGAGLPESASLPTKVPSLELCIDPDDASRTEGEGGFTVLEVVV